MWARVNREGSVDVGLGREREDVFWWREGGISRI